MLLALISMALSAPAVSHAAREAGLGVPVAAATWRSWRPGQAPPPSLFGVAAFEPTSRGEEAQARALTGKTLAWLGIDPAALPAGASLSYRIDARGEAGGPWGETLGRASALLGARDPPESPADFSGWVRTDSGLDLSLASGTERLRLTLDAGRVRLFAGEEALEPRPEDLRFARRRVRNYHPGIWLALALGPGGRLRAPGPEPGRPGLVRLLAALPDGEAMEYVIEPGEGRIVAERAWAKTRAGMGLVTSWIREFREEGSVRVPWTWSSERWGQPVARGAVLRWSWLER